MLNRYSVDIHSLFLDTLYSIYPLHERMIEFFHGNNTNMYSKIQPKDTIWTVKYESPSKNPSVTYALELGLVLLVRQNFQWACPSFWLLLKKKNIFCNNWQRMGEIPEINIHHCIQVLFKSKNYSSRFNQWKSRTK